MSDNIHTLGNWITQQALVDSTKTAIDDRGVTISYGMLDQRINQLATKLIDAGYRNGDRIATVAGNSIDMVVVFFACAQAGLTLAPLSWRATATELAQLITRSKAVLLLTEDEFHTLASEATKQANLAIPVVELGSEGIETHAPTPPAAGPTPRPAWRPVTDHDPVLLIYTSGSEAAPKGVLLSHSNCFWTNFSLGRAVNFGTDDVALCMLPLFHVGGWNIYLLLALSVGATCVLERSFNPARVLRLIETRNITTIMGVPTQYHMMAKDPLFPTANLTTLRVAMVGGSHAPTELLTRWHHHGVELTPAYGLTEAAPNVLYTPPGDPHSGMIPYPHVTVRIGETDTQCGELHVTGPGIFLGYDDDPHLTAQSFTPDGWLRTGDTAEHTPNGRINIIGRTKDIYISGGENVAPAEVERTIATHPYVEEVAVVGMPDPVWGEVGCAFVVLTPQGQTAHHNPQNTEALTVTLRSHTARVLSAFKVPAHVQFVSELPRISIDKIDRRQLSAQAVALSEGVQTS